MPEIKDSLNRPEEPSISAEYARDYPESASYAYMIDPVLFELLFPERQRQYRQIVLAIDRVCEIIENERARRPTSV